MTTPLPPIDPPAPDDKLAGEAELAALYRQLPQSEPSPALNAAVLRQAAQALSASEHPLAVERRRSPREHGDRMRPKDVPLRDIDSIGVPPSARRRLPPWLLTLGSAASLVLVAGLAWHMRGQPTAGVPVSPADEESPAFVGVSAAALPPPAQGRQPGSVASSMTAKTAAAPLPETPPMEIGNNTMMARTATPHLTAQMVRPASRKSLASSHKPSPEPDDARSQQATAADHATAAMPPLPPVVEVTTPAAFAPAPAPPAPADEAMPAPATMTPVRADDPSDAHKPHAQLRELDAIRKLFAEHHEAEAQRRLENFHRSYPQWELAKDLQMHLRKP
jgi:hypothetical protein